MHHMKARLLIILSMAIFGTIGLFVRNIPIPSSEIAADMLARHPE